MIGRTALLPICLLFFGLPCAAGADTMLHFAEVWVEDELSPTIARITTRFEGDYYVTDKGVYVSGWGIKDDGRLYEFDVPGERHSDNPHIFTFKRVANVIDMTSEYNSYTVSRHIEITGKDTCTEVVSVELKQGHKLFESVKIGTNQKVLINRKVPIRSECSIPRLFG